jgi:hypothetical protein
LAEKENDIQLVQVCFRFNFDSDRFLASLSYADLHEYHRRIEGARGVEQVATSTVDYIQEYMALADTNYYDATT